MSVSSAQLPCTGLRYPKSNRLMWTREALSPTGREAKLFVGSPQKSSWTVLSHCSARLLLEGPRRACLTDMGQLIIICLFFSNQFNLQCLSRWSYSQYMEKVGLNFVPKEEPRIIFETKVKVKCFNCRKGNPVNINKKMGKESSVTQSQHALLRPSEDLVHFCCASFH